MKETYNVLKGIYFHEQQVREQMIPRVQINLGVYITFLAMFAYMVRMMDYDSNLYAIGSFYVFGLIFLILIILSMKYTKIAFVGAEYRNFSKATEVLEYNTKLHERVDEIAKYNETYGTKELTPDPDKHTDRFTIRLLTQCIDHNSAINESRRIAIKCSIEWLIKSIVPLGLLSAVFVVADLDVSSPRKNTLIQDKNVAKEISVLSSALFQKSTIPELTTDEVIMSDEKMKLQKHHRHHHRCQ
ncbi:hypothetical protein QWY96_15685 [Vibrio artabrorum]|uniref:DUF4231 domain-containing protein n=1 Tax=Vibrio artabrorum TaxID=446374 RepID=A0ABT8CKN5_9VIBR|nr:hypothetical protein [Vibrio artabrorum]MDN3701974.1 hypothetical protein [Vibrio artabrorum]